LCSGPSVADDARMQVRSIGAGVLATCLVVASFGAATIGCEDKKDDKKSESTSAPASTPAAPAAPPPPATPPPAAPPPATPPPAAPAGDVTRYPTEQPIGRTGVIAEGVTAHKEAKAESQTIATLAKGTGVSQVAQQGNWTLVGWKEGAVDRLGWVQSAKAFGAEIGPTRTRAADEARKRGLLFPK
jgi:hypothetical protein